MNKVGRPRVIKNLIGHIFGRLEVIERGPDYIRPSNGDHSTQWIVKCKCGNTSIVRESSLLCGYTTSCGKCFKTVVRCENDKNILKAAYGIIARCTRSDRHDWMAYGGRGIINELGDNSLDVYLNLRKVPGYFPGAQIDRINPNGNYTIHHPVHGTSVYDDRYGNKCLGNLRWVTSTFNSLNKRTGLNFDKLSVALTPRTKPQLVRGMTKTIVRDDLGPVSDYLLVQLPNMRYRTHSKRPIGYKDEYVYIAIHSKIMNKCPRLYKKIVSNIDSLQRTRKFIDEKWNDVYLPRLLDKIIILTK